MRKTIVLILAILYSLFVLIISLMNFSSLERLSVFPFSTQCIFCKKIWEIIIPFSDKIVHFIIYFVFFLLWSWVLQTKYKVLNFEKMFVLLLGTITFGIFIEILQETCTIYRTLEAYDALANSLGALAAFCCVALVKKIKYR